VNPRVKAGDLSSRDAVRPLMAIVVNGLRPGSLGVIAAALPPWPATRLTYGARRKPSRKARERSGLRLHAAFRIPEFEEYLTRRCATVLGDLTGVILVLSMDDIIRWWYTTDR